MSLISQHYMERYQDNLNTAIKAYVAEHSAVDLSTQKDVSINNPTNGQVLKWNAGLGKWVNANESGGGGGGSVNSLGDIGDIALGTLQDGQIIKWDADAQMWVNAGMESGGKTYIGTCTTAAATAAKEATVDLDFQLEKGVRIGIKFSNSNTASNCTLNVNSTGAKSLYYDVAVYTGTSPKVCGNANRYNYYVYDGTNWVWDSYGVEFDTTYTPQSLGFGFGTCSTAAATVEKAVTLANYNLVTNGYVSVKFTNAVPASATMNINSKGAKAIYYKGVPITANIIKAGDLATFIYSGQYHLVGIDRAVEGSASSTIISQTLAAGSTTVTFSNSAITNSALISVYTSVAGLNYNSISVSNGSVSITYDAQSANMTVTLEIKNV